MQTSANPNKDGEENFFLTIVCQLVNAEEITGTKNPHLATIL
jgi:hypothetical protein